VPSALYLLPHATRRAIQQAGAGYGYVGALDFPAFATVYWQEFDAGRLPRPEYLLPVLYNESGFSTTVTNSIGCVGLNQMCPPNVPDGYGDWSASQQLQSGIAPMFQSIISHFGQIRSGTRAYQANFLPSTLATATTLDSVLATQGSSDNIPGSSLSEAAVYNANPGLDWDGKGYITVADLGHFVAKQSASEAVQNALAAMYAARPGEKPHDPVRGEDFGTTWSKIATVLGGFALGGAIAAGSFLLYDKFGGSVRRIV